MKIEHAIFFPELIEYNKGNAIIQVEELGHYEAIDFNVFLVITLLEHTDLLSEKQLQAYFAQKNAYLFEKLILTPKITYKGDLADAYTLLEIEKEKVMQNPDYKANLTALFQQIHFQENLDSSPTNVDAFRSQHLEIMMAQNDISKQIQSALEINIQTLEWKRLANEHFDYSLPSTLIFQPFLYDEKEYEKLFAIANQIVKSYSFKKEINEFEEEIYLFQISFDDES